MISCIFNNNIYYINKIDDFRDIMSEDTFNAMVSWIEKNELFYKDIIDDMKYETERATEDKNEVESEYSNLQDDMDNMREDIREKLGKIKELIDKIDIYFGYTYPSKIEKYISDIESLSNEIYNIVD